MKLTVTDTKTRIVREYEYTSKTEAFDRLFAGTISDIQAWGNGHRVTAKRGTEFRDYLVAFARA